MIWEIFSLSSFQKMQSKRFTARKARCREKAKHVAGQSFANTSERLKNQSIQSHKRFFEEIKYVTHRSPQSPKIEMGIYIGKIYGQASFLPEWISLTYTGHLQGSENCISVETLQAWNERDRVQNGKKPSDRQNSTYRKQADKNA